MRPVIRAGSSPKQNQLRMQRVIDIRRQIDQADTRPPQPDGCTEIVVIFYNEGDADSEWQSNLEQTAAKGHHEFAERPEQYMPRFVYRQQDIVHEGHAYFAGAIVVSEQEPAPDRQQCQRDTLPVKRDGIHFIQRLEQGGNEPGIIAIG